MTATPDAVARAVLTVTDEEMATARYMHYTLRPSKATGHVEWCAPCDVARPCPTIRALDELVALREEVQRWRSDWESGKIELAPEPEYEDGYANADER